MRRPADWMVMADDRILEYMSENGGTASAMEMHQTGDFLVGHSHLSARLNKMADEGLIRRLGNGVFSITDEARAYLQERYNVEKGVYLEKDQIKDESNDGAAAGETTHDT